MQNRVIEDYGPLVAPSHQKSGGFGILRLHETESAFKFLLNSADVTNVLDSGIFVLSLIVVPTSLGMHSLGPPSQFRINYLSVRQNMAPEEPLRKGQRDKSSGYINADVHTTHSAIPW